MTRRLLTVALVLALVPAAPPARAGSAPPAPDSAARLFGPDRVWVVHLEISARGWEAMHPTRSMPFFGAPVPKGKDKGKDGDRPKSRPRGGFGFDFPFVKADLEFDGRKFKDVGVRFKGNSSYAMAVQGPKRPFKIDLGRFVAGQRLHGLRVLNLANNALDPSQLREALSYSVFRAAGVPAPRTAFVELYLTVPGKYARQFAGLYTLIENVDRTFLKRHFPGGKGLLLKPEGVPNLAYLGPDWAPYQERYRPKQSADAEARQRLLALTRLVHYADDAAFRRTIGRYLDVDEFLRYVAACALMTNIDSFVGFGHNYFLYLNPRDGRFSVLPWDLNNTFGGLLMFGWKEDQVADWSVRKPVVGGNRLTERLLAVKEYDAAYRKHLRALAGKTFTRQALHAEIDRMQKAVQEALAREPAGKKGSSPGGLGAFLGKPADLKQFAGRRAEAVLAQLDGKAEGKGLHFGAFALFMNQPPPGKQLAKPILTAADADKDGKLSRGEVAAALKRLFAECDTDKGGSLDEKGLGAGLRRLLPKPAQAPGWPGGDAGGFGMGEHLAGFVFTRAAVQGGRIRLPDLLALGEGLFRAADANGDGLLDEAELTAALNTLPPAPRLMPLPGARPAAPKAKGKP